AYADFYAGMASASAAAGEGPWLRWQAEGAAGTAYRGTIQVLAESVEQARGAVADAAIRASALQEALGAIAAVNDALKAGADAGPVQGAAGTAQDRLLGSLASASRAAEAAQAFARYNTDITGGASFAMGVVGAFLGVNASTRGSVQAAINATAMAA